MPGPKAAKEEILKFGFKNRIREYDLVWNFGYTYSGAVKRIHRMSREGLIRRIEKGVWIPTKEGRKLLFLKEDLGEEEKEGRSSKKDT